MAQVLTLEGTLATVLEQAFATVLGEEARALGRVTPSDRPDLCDFQCNGALAAAKQFKRAPMQVASDVLAALGEQSDFTVTAAPPGFLNIKVSDGLLFHRAASVVGDERLGVPTKGHPLKVAMDYGGPNVAKAMHVGHMRPLLVGDALVRLIRFAGDDLTTDIHIGDWGTPMGMLIEALKAEHPEWLYFDESRTTGYPSESPVTLDDLNRLYPQASALCKADKAAAEAARLATLELQAGRPGYRALWRHFVDLSLEAVRREMELLGFAPFDTWLGESDVQPLMVEMIEDLKARGVAVLSEGAWVIPVGDDKPPMILVKSDGAVLYSTSDLATVLERVRDMKADVSMTVADQRQSLHFEQVYEAARRAGFVPDHVLLDHVGFGTMNGPDGKPFKTRSGGVMPLREMLDLCIQAAKERIKPSDDMSAAEVDAVALDVARATIKFADLSNFRASDYVFDLEKFSSFEGKTGPYLLYSAVRVKSMLRKAVEMGLAVDDASFAAALQARAGQQIHDAERALLMTLLSFPGVVQEAYARRAPHLICDYAYKAAQAFSGFYTQCPVLNEADSDMRAFRLALSAFTLKALELSLGLVGITVPERM